MNRISAAAIALAGFVFAGSACVTLAADKHTSTETSTVTINAEADSEDGGGGGATGGGKQRAIIIKRIEPGGAADQASRKDLPWLGVAADEAPEVVTSQLGLDPGVGLVVNYLAGDSPAAKAGLQKNDVLVEFEGQSLVLPAQLRKLVQSRQEGDAVKIAFYRGGKKQTVSATLGKTKPGFGLWEDERAWNGDLIELKRQLRDMPVGDAIREQMKTLRESLGRVQIDQKKVQEEARRSMEQARKAMEEALRHATNAGSAAYGSARKAIEELSKSGMAVDNKATVTVRNTGQSVKSIVKADDTGTIAIVSAPKLHLTAHDKDGKLLFDGEIETPAQRKKVPAEVWEKVEPMLDKVAPKAEEEPEAKPAPSKETTSQPAKNPLPLDRTRESVAVR